MKEKGITRTYMEIPIDKIRPNPYQPRKHFDEEALQELTNSIRSIGLLEDILVRSKDDHYEIVHGERRWRACQLAGLESITANVRELSDEEAFEIAIIENIQRENLTDVEQAFAFKEYLDRGMRQPELAARLGKMHKKIAEKLKLLSSHYYIQFQEDEIARLRQELEELQKERGGEKRPRKNKAGKGP